MYSHVKPMQDLLAQPISGQEPAATSTVPSNLGPLQSRRPAHKRAGVCRLNRGPIFGLLISFCFLPFAVSANATATLSAISCNSASFAGQASDPCTVTLSAAAPTGGLKVNLSSNNSVVTVPASVTVPANATSAAFSAPSSWTASNQAVTLKATQGSVSKTFALEVLADIQMLGVSPTTLSFGNVAVNTAVKQSVILTSTGNLPVTVYAPTLTGTGFSISGITFPLTLNPGKTATLSVQFDPSTTGAASGQLTITSNNNWTNPTVLVSLSGTGTAATSAALSAVSCGSASMTGAGTDACTVALSAAAPSGGLSVSLSSSNAAVTVPATVTVPANATSAAFTATVSSVTTAQAVTLKASAGSVSKTFALQLNPAVPTLSLSATSVAFGSVGLNAPATQSVTLTSTGTAPVTISAATLTGTGFTMSGATFPVTLNPSQVATLTVQFDPTTAGAATGQLTITSNSSTNGTATIALSGTGMQPQVSLSWNAPSSSTDPVAGYNIYRSTGGSSSYQLVNSSVDAQTTYVDTTVQNGLTYDYIVESVDASGVVSSPSNTLSITTP